MIPFQFVSCSFLRFNTGRRKFQALLYGDFHTRLKKSRGYNWNQARLSSHLKGIIKTHKKINAGSCTPKETYVRTISRRYAASNDHISIKNLDDVAEYILQPSTSSIIVLAGAGISTPCGIPDFRTPGTGLYDNLQKYNLSYPEAIFDINFFYMDHRPFFTLAKELYPGKYKPSVTHYFIKLLHKKNKLLRMFTQNIDGLERLAGIPEGKLTEAHGSFATATCMNCHCKYDGELIKDEIFTGKIPLCRKDKCKGIIKPDIVFFGELLPPSFWYYAREMAFADLLIVMGTSLVVEPFSSLADMVRYNIPRILINKNVVGSFASSVRENDVIESGDVVEVVKRLVNKIGWNEDLASIMRNAENTKT